MSDSIVSTPTLTLQVANETNQPSKTSNNKTYPSTYTSLPATTSESKAPREDTAARTMNPTAANTRTSTSEPDNNKTPSPYYNSSAFFAQTLNAAALHVKSEMAAEQGTARRRRDSVHDGALDGEESIAGVGGTGGVVAFGRVGGLGVGGWR